MRLSDTPASICSDARKALQYSCEGCEYVKPVQSVDYVEACIVLSDTAKYGAGSIESMYSRECPICGSTDWLLTNKEGINNDNQ